MEARTPARLRQRNLSHRNKIARLIWRTVWICLFRPSPRWAHAWRRLLLRIFGASLEAPVYIYPSTQIWAPWNLQMERGSCLSHFVDCYNVDQISLGRNSTVSQYSFLCTATHDFDAIGMPLLTSPIRIGNDCWIAADVFVGPGVSMSDGAVALARSTVLRDIHSLQVVAGTPSRFIRMRSAASLCQSQTSSIT